MWKYHCVPYWPHSHLPLHQDYVTRVASLVHEGQYSLHFLVGQSYLTTGELDKAEDHFVRAAGGLGRWGVEAVIEKDESLLDMVHAYNVYVCLLLAA